MFVRVRRPQRARLFASLVGRKSSSPFDQPPRAGSARPASQFAARCCPPGSSSGLCPAGTPPPRWTPRGRLSGMRTRCVTRALRFGLSLQRSHADSIHRRFARSASPQPPLTRHPPPSPLTDAGLHAGQLFPSGDVRAPRHGRPLLHQVRDSSSIAPANPSRVTRESSVCAPLAGNRDNGRFFAAFAVANVLTLPRTSNERTNAAGSRARFSARPVSWAGTW